MTAQPFEGDELTGKIAARVVLRIVDALRTMTPDSRLSILRVVIQLEAEPEASRRELLAALGRQASDG